MKKDDLDSFKIEDMQISEILDEFRAESLGIKEGYQILKINGKSIPKQDLKDFLNSEDFSEFEFELQVFLTVNYVTNFSWDSTIERQDG